MFVSSRQRGPRAWVLTIFASAITSFLVVGCSSDSSSSNSSVGAGVSFSLPSSVNVISSKTNGASAIGDEGAFTTYLDASSDYMTVSQDFDRVNHPVGEALSTVSNIMCFIGLLGTDKMWSETKLPRVYLVGVDDSSCDSSKGQPQQGAASGGSGSSSKSLKMVTVRLSREAAGAFPRMEIWFTEPNGPSNSPMEIRASVDVLTIPNSATAPNGQFNMAFAMTSSSGTSLGGGNLIMRASPSPISYTFYQNMSSGSFSDVKGASVETKADGSGLKAAVQSAQSGGGGGSSSSAWVVATNSTSVKANSKKANNTAASTVSEVSLTGGQCLSLQNFNYRIYGYGLFKESDGSAVQLSTGVGCKYTDSSGQSKNCYIGKQGAWFERETSGSEHTMADGDTVTRQEWGSGAANNGQTLTIGVKSGKLTKYTVRKYNLSEIDGVELRYFDSSGGTEYIVAYLAAGQGGAGAGFYKLASMSWGSSGPTKTDIAAASGNKLTIGAGNMQNFYSESFGGVMFVGGQTFITAREETVVMPTATELNSGSLALKCIGRCPKNAISQANLQTWAGPYQTDPANKGAALDYYFEKSTMKLFKGTDNTSANEVKLASGVSFSGTNSQFTFGLDSGALLDASTYAAITNLYDVYGTAGNTYYQYRIGPNSWDKLLLVSDGSNYLSFDDPMALSYTHTTANDRNGDSTYNNKKFLLRYRGYGQMDGLPWDQIDRDGDGTPDMWFPKIALKDGIQLTANSINYRIKAMFGEKTLTTTGASCTDIATMSLPTTAVPTATTLTASNASTTKPSYGTCIYSTETKSSTGCN